MINGISFSGMPAQGVLLCVKQTWKFLMNYSYNICTMYGA